MSPCHTYLIVVSFLPVFDECLYQNALILVDNSLTTIRVANMGIRIVNQFKDLTQESGGFLCPLKLTIFYFRNL